MPFDELKDFDLLWRKNEKGQFWNPCDWAIRTDVPDEQPSLWFSVVGQRGLWPVAYRDPPAGPKGSGLEGFTFRTRNISESIGPEPFATQFLPIMPQFTWQWGVVFLGLSFAA